MCKGNETHLMQCTMMSTNSDCHPVLVKCVSSSESANSNINIAAVLGLSLGSLLLITLLSMTVVVQCIVIFKTRKSLLKTLSDCLRQIAQ